MTVRAHERLSIVRKCAADPDDGDITVCGRRNDHDRLLLATEPDAERPRVAADLPGGMAALTPGGRCGIFQGERRCAKAEALDYGYGGGRDPITVLTQVVGKVIGPQTD